MMQRQPTQSYPQSAQQLEQPERFPRSGDANLAAVQPRYFPTRNAVPEAVRHSSIQLLNQCLADSMVLLTQAKAAHWNVKGMNFYQLHRLFDDVAQMFFRHSDEMAERITTLGGQAIGTVHAASRRSSIPPLQRPLVTGPFYVATLADHIAIHDAKLSQDIERATQRGDVDTADLLNEISREVSKHLWFLEAHLQTHPLSHRHRSADQPGPSATGLSL